MASSSSSSKPQSPVKAGNSKLFRAYIGAMFKGVKFTDVPINPNVQFDFLLSFAIDYTNSSAQPSTPTNGKFNIFWDSNNLSPSQVSSIKSKYSNVRVGLSIGGDSVHGKQAYFEPTSIGSWVSNAVSSLTRIIQDYKLDGIDINYEHFKGDPTTFSECIGQLIKTLKEKELVKFVSIAPFDNSEIQRHYLPLWKSKYGKFIDYVNFQFYAYNKSTTIPQFISYFDKQTEFYKGGKILVSYISNGSVGLPPGKDFFEACKKLKEKNKLHGIFFWCADDSKSLGFRHEKQAQELLAAP